MSEPEYTPTLEEIAEMKERIFRENIESGKRLDTTAKGRSRGVGVRKGKLHSSYSQNRHRKIGD